MDVKCVADIVTMLENARKKDEKKFVCKHGEDLIFAMRYVMETNMAKYVEVRRIGVPGTYNMEWEYTVEWNPSNGV